MCSRLQMGLVKRCLVRRWCGLQRVSVRQYASLQPVPGCFAHASRAHTVKQANHKSTAEEEQELLESAPTSTLPGISPEGLAADPAACADTLAEDGVVRLNSLLSANVCSALRDHIDGMLEQSMQQVASGSIPYSSLFGEFMCREERYDLLLPLDDRILGIVQQLVESVAPLLEHAIGEQCTMCELEALVSDPGSHAQPLHFDTPFDLNEPRVTMLIALQDVTAAMGPTAFYPGTNAGEWHIAYKQRDQQLEELLEFCPRIVGEMATGDAFVYDGRVLHFGGANVSHLPDSAGVAADVGIRRTLLGLSFQVESGHFRTDNTNMRSHQRSKYRIPEASKWTAAV